LENFVREQVSRAYLTQLTLHCRPDLIPSWSFTPGTTINDESSTFKRNAHTKDFDKHRSAHNDENSQNTARAANKLQGMPYILGAH
jgi:hypothetical protein